jgi:hypothetical protein
MKQNILLGETESKLYSSGIIVTLAGMLDKPRKQIDMRARGVRNIA